MKSRKWNVQNIILNKKIINDERFEQLLAEVGEVLYKRLCQQVSSVKGTNLSSTTEPSLTGLDKDNNFNQDLKVLKKGS